MIDYRNIIKSRKLRMAIMSVLRFIPDSIMLRLQYYIQVGRWPNLSKPERFTEKIQVYKMKYRNPLMGKCVDKYEVQKYVEKCGLSHILNKCYGIYDNAEEIDFTKLPNQFVIKTTDGGGGNNVFLCRDKKTIDIPSTVTLVNSWKNFLNTNPGREWAYTKISKSRVLVEALIESDRPDGELIDYKVYCFSGKVSCIQVITGRPNITIDFFDRQWNRLEGVVGLSIDAHNSEFIYPKPENFDKMMHYAEVLAKPFPFVRVDLYNNKGQITFGELTFYPASGYGKFNPDSFDFELGAKLDINTFVQLES